MMDKTEIENLIENKINLAEKNFGKEAKTCIIEILSLEKMLNQKQKETRLIPFSKWNEYYPYPSVYALRMLRFYNKNNFNSVIVKNGKRILIDELAFIDWLKKNEQIA